MFEGPRRSPRPVRPALAAFESQLRRSATRLQNQSWRIFFARSEAAEWTLNRSRAQTRKRIFRVPKQRSKGSQQEKRCSYHCIIPKSQAAQQIAGRLGATVAQILGTMAPSLPCAQFSKRSRCSWCSAASLAEDLAVWKMGTCIPPRSCSECVRGKVALGISLQCKCSGGAASRCRRKLAVSGLLRFVPSVLQVGPCRSFSVRCQHADCISSPILRAGRATPGKARPVPLKVGRRAVLQGRPRRQYSCRAPSFAKLVGSAGLWVLPPPSSQKYRVSYVVTFSVTSRRAPPRRLSAEALDTPLTDARARLL